MLLFGAPGAGDGQFSEPWLYGYHTGISLSLALLLTTVFWTVLWDLRPDLSTPLTVCVVVLEGTFRSSRFYTFYWVMNQSSKRMRACINVFWLWTINRRGMSPLFTCGQLWRSCMIPC